MKRAYREVIAKGPENFWAFRKGEGCLGTGYRGSGWEGTNVDGRKVGARIHADRLATELDQRKDQQDQLKTKKIQNLPNSLLQQAD
jgi:hypothetical protein